MQNPVERIMNERSLSARDLSILADVQRSTVSHLLKGYAATLSGRILESLIALGYDGAELAKEYAEWRKSLRDELKKQFA